MVRGGDSKEWVVLEDITIDLFDPYIITKAKKLSIKALNALLNEQKPAVIAHSKAHFKRPFTSATPSLKSFRLRSWGGWPKIPLREDTCTPQCALWSIR